MGVLYLLVVWVSSVLSQCCSDICCSVFAVHLWRYRGGYPALTECLTKLNNNKVGDEVLLNRFLCYTHVISNTYLMFSAEGQVYFDLSFICTLHTFCSHKKTLYIWVYSFFFLLLLFLHFNENILFSLGVFRVSEREGKNVDFKEKSAPSGVQFLEWTLAQSRTLHLWNAHLSPQGINIYCTYLLLYYWYYFIDNIWDSVTWGTFVNMYVKR